MGFIGDLLEPGFSKEIAPYVIANQMFPDDWFKRTTSCSKNCHICGYCDRVLVDVLIDTAGVVLGVLAVQWISDFRRKKHVHDQ